MTSTPVMFVHGLWLFPSSWNHWAALFEEAGGLDEPQAAERGKEQPKVFAR